MLQRAISPAMQTSLRNTIRFAFTVAAVTYLGSLALFGEEPHPSSQVTEQHDEHQACAAALLGSTTVATINGTPLVTVFANGAPLFLILDTGAQRTVITPAAAERIAGEPPRVEFQRGINGIAGALPAREIKLRSYRIGGVIIPWDRITVAQIATPPIFTTPLDGVLGADALSAFDIDLDLPHHQITLYERGRCGSPNWSGEYVKIEAGHSRGDHLFFPVLLDNLPITGIIDTGAQNMTLS